MKNLEEFIENDKQGFANEYLFDAICKRADREQALRLPKGLSRGLLVCCVLAAAVLSVNLLTSRSESELLAQSEQNAEFFESFTTENYFDILSDYYPEKLLDEKLK